MRDAERWARVGALFDRAVAVPPDERETIICASGEPSDVQDEVRSLVAAHDESGVFLEGSALEAGGRPSPDAGSIVQEEAPPLAEGARLGPYRIQRLLGRGGMGVVYQAEDTRLHRSVALKLLSPQLAGDRRQRLRLQQEARAAAALTHPGIATIYALEELDGELVIVSEYLVGETLRAELARGPLPPSLALSTALAIAHAVAAAHERGIVHRDLKPENILRTTTGTVKILDFGLAQFDAAARDLSSITRLTETGLVAGTPPYMAPEQLLGRTTDVRTDQFAFGVLLYEMWTGRHAFGGASLPSIIARILAADPQPPDSDAAVPAEVWRVIEQCLQKDPARRFESTGALVARLEHLEPSVRAERALAAPATRPAHPSPAPGPEHPAAAPGPEHPAPGTQHSAPPLGTQHSAPAPGTQHPALAPGTQHSALSTPFWWWQFHQMAAAVAYSAMVWPAWHVHRAFGAGGLFFFFATLVAVVVAAILRLHLWFSSRIYPAELAIHRADVVRWIRWADVAFVTLLVAGGLLLPEERAPWATLFVSVGIGSAVASLVIEPATARAAFRPR